MKVVLDSNVLLAAFATHGLCEAILAVCLDQHEIVLSESILSEVAELLEKKFKLPKRQVQENIVFLREHSQIVEPMRVSTDVCRDPDDLMVLGTATAANADCIVTGDNDLLSLRSFGTIPIILPREFYERSLES